MRTFGFLCLCLLLLGHCSKKVSSEIIEPESEEITELPDTLRYLEEGLTNFKSCALVISHDRYFLDRICTHLIAFEGNGEVGWYEGGFEEYERVKSSGGASVFENRRARYRKLHIG